MYDYLSQDEKNLKRMIERRGEQVPGEAQYDKADLGASGSDVEVSGFAPTTTPDSGGMSSQQMGSALGGASKVSQASGGSGAITGALGGAAAGAPGGPWGMAIGAAVGLTAGLLGDKAAREEQRRQTIIESLKVEMAGKQRAYAQEQQGVQTGIGQILGGTARALS